MDSSKISDWLQVIGMFGVIGSLMFVGLQMKQDQEIALSVAAQSRAELTVQFMSDRSSNPYYLTGIAKVDNEAWETLTAEERESLTQSYMAQLFLYENIHDQYERGFINDERWIGTRENIAGSLGKGRPMRLVYEATESRWRSSFRKVVDELIVEVDAEAGSEPGSDPR
jgi:hypothetical protein